jgi:hypothetical protein
MNKILLLDLLAQDLEKNVEKYYDAEIIEKYSLEDTLYELNNRKAIEIPSSLPKTAEEMIVVLRKHLPDDVTLISCILNHYFPEEFFFYRVSKVEPEIFEGIEFFSEVVPELRFRFNKIGKRGFEEYLELNKSLMKIAKRVWPDLKRPQLKLAYFLYQGLADLFLEKSEYNRYWIMATYPEYFEGLDSSEKSVPWSGRKEIRPGDLVFMYRTAPRKAITDILRVKDEPFFDPWGAWDGFWLNLEKVCAVEDITISQMRDDPVLGQWGLVRRNFVGTVTEPVPHSIYNRLLDHISKAIREEYGLKPEPVADIGRSGQFTSEAEFEEKVIEPLLKRWGFRFARQHSCRFSVGSQYYDGRVDFYVSDGGGPVTLFENKFRIINDEKDLRPAVDQAKSYALMLGLPSFVVASPEGMWLYSLEWNKETLVKKVSADEISSQAQEEEFRSLLQKLRR